MNIEIEAKFLEVDHEQLRAQLKELGAECEQPMRLMRRVIFHPRLNPADAFFRVRDEGHEVTLTYKHFQDSSSIHGVTEIETTVGDFDTAILILEKMDLSKDAYQETRRETWKLGDVEIMLDEWPWVSPFVEIEGPSEDAVHEVADKLGFDWAEAVYGGVASVFKKELDYDGDIETLARIINRETPIIKFDMPMPESLK